MNKAKQWIENYWYHYKWPTVVVLFFAAVISICIVQMVNRTDYNMYVRYVGDQVITDTQYNDILASLGKLKSADKEDPDAEPNFAQVAYVSDDENPYKNEINANAKATLSGFIVQPYYIYIMDAAAYELYKSESTFATLNQTFDTDVSDIAYDEFAVYFNKTEFYKNSPGMEWVEDDTVIVLKVAPYKSIITDSKYRSEVKAFDAHTLIFKEIVGR